MDKDNKEIRKIHRMSDIDKHCGEKQGQVAISRPGTQQELLPTPSTFGPVTVTVNAPASPSYAPAGARPLGAQGPCLIPLRAPPHPRRHAHRHPSHRTLWGALHIPQSASETYLLNNK